MNVADILGLPAAASPEQPAVTFAGRTWSYGAMWQRALVLAGALARTGVRAGDVVGLMATNSPAFVDLLVASGLLGATFVPLNYRAKREELAHLVSDARIGVLFCQDRYLDLVSAVASQGADRRVYSIEGGSPSVPGIRRLVSGATPLDRAAASGGPVALVMYTSGTTGLPKAVPMSHQALVGYVLQGGQMADGTPRGANLVSAPLYHVAGLTSLLTSLFQGLRAVLLPQFEPDEWLATVEAERITHAFLVPTMLKQVLDARRFAATDLSSLRMVSYGAAPMPMPVIRLAIERFPAQVSFSQSFGQTETAGTVSVLGPEDHRLEGPADLVATRRRRLGSVGRPVADVEIRIAAPDGSEVAAGTIGEVLIRSSWVSARESAGGEPMGAEGSWHRTGDLGWLDEDGYLFLAGRAKDLIIRAGENIAPAEVETVLAAHPGVDGAAVVGLPDEEWGERVAAAVVPRQGFRLEPADLVAHCRARLASYKVPERIALLPELPRNALGKVLKTVLRETLQKVAEHVDPHR